MRPIRIFLADDHVLVRSGIRALLQRLPEVEVIGEASTGLEALDLVRTRIADVALVDISMPQLSGLDLTARLGKECPRVRVLILSMYHDEEHVLQALAAGAAGYLVKDAATAELELAVRAVARGETYLSPAVAAQVAAGARHQSGGRTPCGCLTPRQREILQLVAEGRTTKEIARLLHISSKTVETHRAQLMQRLGLHDIAGLVRYALHKGLLPTE